MYCIVFVLLNYLLWLIARLVLFLPVGRPQFYLFMITVSLATQVVLNYANIWLTTWGAATQYSEQVDHVALSYSSNLFYLGQYAYLVVLGSFASLLNILANLEHRTVASKNIHQRLLTAVISATMGFFDTTPLGRIMNVFSGDIRGLG